MDGTPGGQSSQNNGEKKPQLSWSQPVTTSGQKVNTSQNTTPKVSPTSSTHTAPVEKSNAFRNTVIAVLLLAAVGIVVSVVMSKHDDAETNTVVPSTTATSTIASSTASTTGVQQPGTSIMAGGAFSVASPQAAGLHVAVSNISVTIPTWVVIYENHNGQPGNVLGAGLFMAGNTSGTVDLLRGTLPGQTYFVGQARDDGDHMFSMSNDPAIRDANGNPMWIEFKTN